MLQMLRRDFWRYVRAGVVVGLATAIGLVLLIVPGVLVAIATPVVIRRVTCHQQAAMPALIASVKEVGSSPVGAGLLKWELVAGLLMLGSVLLCGVPLLITIPLGDPGAALSGVQRTGFDPGLIPGRTDAISQPQRNGGGGSGQRFQALRCGPV